MADGLVRLTVALRLATLDQRALEARRLLGRGEDDGERSGVRRDLDDDGACRALDALCVEALHGHLALSPGAFESDHGPKDGIGPCQLACHALAAIPETAG